MEVHSTAGNLHTRSHSVHGSRPEAGMAACGLHLHVRVDELRFLYKHTRLYNCT